eukprot:15446282-Alexandrium_andersonii.AAC.1
MTGDGEKCREPMITMSRGGGLLLTVGRQGRPRLWSTELVRAFAHLSVLSCLLLVRVVGLPRLPATASTFLVLS